MTHPTRALVPAGHHPDPTDPPTEGAPLGRPVIAQWKTDPLTGQPILVPMPSPAIVRVLGPDPVRYPERSMSGHPPPAAVAVMASAGPLSAAVAAMAIFGGHAPWAPYAVVLAAMAVLVSATVLAIRIQDSGSGQAKATWRADTVQQPALSALSGQRAIETTVRPQLPTG